jgi:hypothetical protein
VSGVFINYRGEDSDTAAALIDRVDGEAVKGHLAKVLAVGRGHHTCLICPQPPGASRASATREVCPVSEDH